jgi:glutamine amidotransferase-like uncharacterized protein
MNIAVFVHQPVCAVSSINGVVKALGSVHSFKFFSIDEVEPTFFNDVDCVCFPGGYGDADRFDRLLKWNHDAIVNFVRSGGLYLGICMGAYWAGKHYFNILENIDVKQYYKRSTACTKRPHPKAMPIEWLGKYERMYFYDGPCFIGNNMDVVARYSNGDPMAIIKNNIGLIGCHLESEKWWYDKRYLVPHWHQGKHFQLLIDFVDRLQSYRRFPSSF